MPTSRCLRRAAALLSAGTLLFAAGCGETENEKFVSKANETCSNAQKEIKAASGNPTALIAAGKKFVAELKQIDPPEEKKETYQRWLATQEDFFTEFEAALRARDAKRIDALDEKSGDDLATSLGIDACKG